MTRLSILVRVVRGPIVESWHRFQLAAVTPDGALEAATDSPDVVTTFRSAAKPFQLLPFVERGHAERFGFDDEAVAVMSASHTGSARHLELVRGILERIGQPADALRCGFHEPLDPSSLAELRANPSLRSPLYNNCSGKHAGMLAMCVAEGWPVAGYTSPSHPLQQLIRRTMGEVTGRDPASLLLAVDGCSVPVFGLPLSGMARAYARLAAARPAGDARERALARIREAMMRFPAATGGAGRFSTALMEATPGRLVAKGGAEGLECVGVPANALGLAIKCEDGAARGVGPATVAALEALGLLRAAERTALETFARPVVTNHAGLEVGAIEAAVSVAAGAAR
ncbi:MAG TPA: asparaginase [Candidatus Eisenbacteria bacterium]|nr:asparaginase [Candidatus Eisenbacteria bacterium]